MSATNELVLATVRVTESPEPFRLSADLRWWDAHRRLFPDPESRMLRPFTLDLEAYCLGKRLFFRGPVSGAVELSCGRCLEAYEQVFEDRVELLLEPLALQPREEPPEGGIALDPEDLEIGRYLGDEVDFGVVLREILLFNWPMQPRCAEGCLGLCPSCGVNRNTDACSCDDDAGTRPFAGLAALMGRGGADSD